MALSHVFLRILYQYYTIQKIDSREIQQIIILCG